MSVSKIISYLLFEKKKNLFTNSINLKMHLKALTFLIYKKSGKKSIPQEQPNQNKRMKIADPVLLIQFMRDNENSNKA